MTNNFALLPHWYANPSSVQRSVNTVAGLTGYPQESIGVSPRTVEAWARGERLECEGPPALLMAYTARMIVNETYSDISLDEVTRIVERLWKEGLLLSLIYQRCGQGLDRSSD